MGTFPEAIAITPNGQTAYVANYGDGTVTPITTATNAAGHPLSVGTGPDAIAISPNGQTAYVVNGDTMTSPLRRHRRRGHHHRGGELSRRHRHHPERPTAYVANNLDGTVTPIDLATQTAEPPITVGSDPSAIAITPDGTTAYVTGSGNTVTPIDVATQTAEPTITVGSDPSAAAFSPDGTTAFVANYGSDSVTPICHVDRRPRPPSPSGTVPGP